MAKCKFCGKKDKLISLTLKICRECILTKKWEKVRPFLLSIHENIRNEEGLSGSAPQCNDSEMKITCNLCINECSLSSEDVSYCGLRRPNDEEPSNLPLPSKKKGYIHGYIDANPTNCCNSWFCPAGTSEGYPEYSTKKGPEYGTYSYAAFIYGCSFNCLFCQNSTHSNVNKRQLRDAESIAKEIVENKKITCVCYFGGTPETQLPFTINLSELILAKINKDRIMRFCWEWNGSGNQKLVEKCMKIALKTGGNIKFDLKTYQEKLSYALSGQSNKRTLENFKFLGKNYFGKREELHEMSGCTLLVPGYTTSEEVEKITQFIASINRKIPYSLLIFHPDYYMSDLPYTSKKQAYKCLEVAQEYLENVHLGNRFLLGFST
jgi:pyruvate formate lyase activating enzyme